MTEATVRLLGVAGSLRMRSYNRALLRAAIELAPPGLTIDVYDGIRHLPLYDADLDRNQEGDRQVEDWRAAIAAVDGLLIVTPEYNFSLPGLLKNAIDWGSRPRVGAVLRDKPAGIMGASESLIGTARAQLALRQVMQSLAMPVMMYPEVLVAESATRFDTDLQLVHEPTRECVADYLVALRDWVRDMAARQLDLAAS